MSLRCFEISGSKEAARIIDQYKQNAFSDSDLKKRLVQIEDGKSANTLLIADCGNDMCAGISVAEGCVVNFNKKNQKKFVSINSVAR